MDIRNKAQDELVLNEDADEDLVIEHLEKIQESMNEMQEETKRILAHQARFKVQLTNTQAVEETSNEASFLHSNVADGFGFRSLHEVLHLSSQLHYTDLSRHNYQSLSMIIMIVFYAMVNVEQESLDIDINIPCK